jgi:hypothetical protein
MAQARPLIFVDADGVLNPARLKRWATWGTGSFRVACLTGRC